LAALRLRPKEWPLESVLVSSLLLRLSLLVLRLSLLLPLSLLLLPALLLPAMLLKPRSACGSAAS
jgi:hypothetical protein